MDTRLIFNTPEDAIMAETILDGNGIKCDALTETRLLVSNSDMDIIECLLNNENIDFDLIQED